MSVNSSYSVEQEAAKIAVIALRASLDPSPRVDSDSIAWRVDSVSKRLTSEDVVAMLAKAPKPIECRAVTDSKSGIDLECRPPSDSLPAFIEMSADYVLNRIQNAWGNADTASVDVLVQSDQEQAVVSYSAFAHWLRSYSIGNVSVEYKFDPPPAEAVRLGARMLVLLARRLK